MDFKGFYDEIIFDVDRSILKSYTGKQGDTKSRGLYVTVTQKNAAIEDLTGLSMRLFYEKPDKTRGFIDGVVDGNKFRIDYTNQMYAVPGVVKAELRLMGADGEIITAKTFKILVDSSIADGSIVSENERGILDRAFELAEDIIPRLELLDVELLEDVQAEMLGARHSNTKDETYENLGDRLDAAEQDLLDHKAEYTSNRQQDQLKIAKVEKELNDYKATMQQVNINQEPKQKATGYGVISLPPNAAEGQVSVTVKGNTETDEEGNTKSTLCGAVKSIGKNIVNLDRARPNLRVQSIQVYDDRIVVIPSVADCNIIVPVYMQAGKTYRAKVVPRGTFVVGGTPIYNVGTPPIITPSTNVYYGIWWLGNADTNPITIYKQDIIISLGTEIPEYEPYKETVAYLPPNLTLRSLPNGTKDEINVTDRKLIKRIGEKSNIANGMVIDFADMAEGGTYYAWNEDGETETGIKGDTLGIDATTLIYQLAEPVEIPVQVSGSIASYPNGTIYIERILPDAGVYTDKITILHQDAPIKRLDKLSKVDFMTGIETELDISKAQILEDKLSFTHPELNAGDIVFFEYEYDVESTEGEAEVEFYDSRYVVKDTETDKFYKWNIVVANGQPSIELVEV